ncbi:hypothetical protein ACFPES_27650 [Paenibacillus sp. GCM10023248]|uniref:hypothetical protein n=1 Tax=Bacillales TaxID=1385 RepID=UPI002377F35E|nr:MULTISPECIES: hypothetical protein [Bacillales]MDD9270839.1 hypothetical protein [Paenibacillus sp. MAHUQ-63]MDR6883250.1 hypothetical protein [Bacillus sp. 3255]
MKKWLILMVTLAAVVAAAGCAKKNEEAASPSPTVSAGATVQPSAGASATPSGTSGGTGGTATATPAAGGTNTTKEEPLPQLTREQADKISMTSTYDEMVKATGVKGKLVKEENGKRTYEFAISNQPGYYMRIVYFADGKISEKNVYQK